MEKHTHSHVIYNTHLIDLHVYIMFFLLSTHPMFDRSSHLLSVTLEWPDSPSTEFYQCCREDIIILGLSLGWHLHNHIIEQPSTCIYVYTVIVVSWFLQCMGYVPRKGCMYFMYFRGRSPRKYEGGTYPMHCKNHETAVLYNRPRKATAQR